MGATSSSLSMASYGVQGLSSIGSAVSQANAIKAQGEYEKTSYDINARFADMRAEDAIRRGKRDVETQRKGVKKLIGSQRAALAAQGIDVEDGSALDVQVDTAGQGELDALTISNNAWREAWGYRAEASDMRSRGRMAGISAKYAARDTLLTGGMKALGYGLQFGSEYQKGREGSKTPPKTKGKGY